MHRKSQPDMLSPIQHLILAAAAGHPEHRLTRPDSLKPSTYRSALQALRRRGLITDAPREGVSRRLCAGTILSPSGLAQVIPAVQVAPAALEVQLVAGPEATEVRAPRPATKLAILTLLSRRGGAGIDELVATLGWLTA